MSFTDVPMELLQEIFLGLPDLHSLQSAILSSRTMYYAYLGHRTDIIRRVFYTQLLSLKDRYPTEWEVQTLLLFIDSTRNEFAHGTILMETVRSFMNSNKGLSTLQIFDYMAVRQPQKIPATNTRRRDENSIIRFTSGKP